MVAIAVRKWSGMHEGKYIEVLAGSPKRYLEALGPARVKVVVALVMQPTAEYL